MPAFQTEVPHTLGQEQATARLKQFVDTIREHYKDQISQIDGAWQENKLNFSLTTFGFAISGDLTVEEEKALLEGQLPFAAVAFKGKIVEGFRSELEKALAPKDGGKPAEEDS